MTTHLPRTIPILLFLALVVKFECVTSFTRVLPIQPQKIAKVEHHPRVTEEARDVNELKWRTIITSLKMNKRSDSNDKVKKNTTDGVLFPPGLILLCSLLLPYSNPYLVGAVFIIALVAYNAYIRQKDT
mmetsp:Transcript_1539/g.2102  ORF Transcript_1539/g.2102 Transcript_1539/m.2102 type:complete len:129 (-) Transcript_1539:526-912(-)